MVVLATSPAHLWSSTPDGGVEVPSFANHPAGLPADLEYVALRLLGDMDQRSTARLAVGNAVMGVLHRTGEGTVLTVGCTDWAFGLDPDPDPVVSRITDNILERFGATRSGACSAETGRSPPRRGQPPRTAVSWSVKVTMSK
jgi:hypothetical protein